LETEIRAGLPNRRQSVVQKAMTMPSWLLLSGLFSLVTVDRTAAEAPSVTSRTVDPASCLLLAEASAGLSTVDRPARPSAIDQHRRIRARLGVEMPQTPTMILVLAQATHHTTVAWSSVATRGEDGLWRIDTVGEESGVLIPMDPRPLDRSSKALSITASRALDAALADPCFYQEPAFQFRQGTLGATYFTMDIVTPAERRVIVWQGRPRGLTGRVSDLVIGPG
jgi:hypothetical protein